MISLRGVLLATSGEEPRVVWNVQDDSTSRVLRLLANLPNSAPKAQLELVQNGQIHVLAKTDPAAYAGYTAYQWQSVRVIRAAAGTSKCW